VGGGVGQTVRGTASPVLTLQVSLTTEVRV
jgi:hypothetical protein